jgi:rod shape-determining protein MreC
MAILENRVRINKGVGESFKTILLILKNSLIVIFLALSIYLLYFANHKKISNYTLEITGSIISESLTIYEKIFAPIIFLSNKFIYFRDLKAENLSLKFELVRLNQLESELQFIKAENLALKKLLNVVADEEYKHITARLLSISLNPFSKSVLIGAGTEQGVKVDQIVTNAEGLVGRIIQVSENYSKVMLINDFNSRIPIVTLLTHERGILSGNNNKPQIIYLQKNHSVKKGEKVITSGDGVIFPPGIPVARIVEVNGLEVLIEPIVNLCETNFVNVHSKEHVNKAAEKLNN